MIIKALSEDSFEWDGEFYKIPRTSIRPRPISHPERRFYASSVSPESAEVMAKLGFGLLIVMQNEWPKAAEDVHRYRAMVESVGHTPQPPIILTNVACAPTREEARDWAMRYLSEKWDSIDNHYHFSDGHLATVKGYESYGKLAKTYTKMKDASFRAKATDFYVSIQIVGTPDDCIQQIARTTAADRNGSSGDGVLVRSMPHHLAELNMRLFAEQVLPVLQRDAAFQGVVDPAGAGRRRGEGAAFRTGVVLRPSSGPARHQPPSSSAKAGHPRISPHQHGIM